MRESPVLFNLSHYTMETRTINQPGSETDVLPVMPTGGTSAGVRLTAVLLCPDTLSKDYCLTKAISPK